MSVHRTMTDTDICEAYFKALGWKYFIDWMPPYNAPHLDELPNILESFSAFREHVLEVMGEEGYLPSITIEDTFAVDEQEGSNCLIFAWCHLDKAKTYEEEIKDKHLLKAGIIASTRYWEARNGKE